MADPHEFLKSRFPDDLGEFKGVDISVVDDGKDVERGTPKREKIRGKSIDLYTALYMCLERNDALNRKFHVEFKEAGAVPEKWLKLDEDTERHEVLNTDKTMSLRVVITESKCVFSHTSFLSSGSDGTFKIKSCNKRQLREAQNHDISKSIRRRKSACYSSGNR